MAALCVPFLLLSFLPLLLAQDSSTPLVWAVRLTHNDHNTVASDIGLISSGSANELMQDVYEFTLSQDDHTHLIKHLRSRDKVVNHLHSKIASHPHVKWVEHQFTRKRDKRQEIHFNDPSFSHQWHLVNHQEIGHDVNVTHVWLSNITGVGVTVAVVDDGLQHRNMELSLNYNAEGSYDFNDYDYDPDPDTSSVSNSHGTRCAGLVASVANNSICGVGVAYNSSVSGIRLLDGVITDLLEAKALTYKTHVNHIYSCSWGPTDDGITVEAPGNLAQLAFQLGTQRGRYGYGSIFVFASGNGGNKQDNCNFDGYANSIYTVTIGAVDELDKKPYYAEECSSKLAVTYSNGVKRGDRNIVTADITKGHSCTSGFSGTSAAAPMAAGLIALALQVRDCLTWRDVQGIIVYSAVPIDNTDGEWSTNGASFMHSHQHGFGVLDAYRLTRSAQVWPLLPAQIKWSSDVYYSNSPIPYSQDNKLIHNITLHYDDIPPLLKTLEHVAVTVSIDHTYRGALIIDIVSPSGTVSHLSTARKKDSSSKGLRDWTFTTVRCWGEVPQGVWSLQVGDDTSVGLPPDNDGDKRGRLIQWKLTLYGTNLSAYDILYRRNLVESVVNGDDSLTTSSCPPRPTNLQDITFPDSPIGNKLLKVLSALAAVIVSILFLHILITYIYRRMKDRKLYRSVLPPVNFRSMSSTTAEEEEGLLLEPHVTDTEHNEWNDEINENTSTL